MRYVVCPAPAGIDSWWTLDPEDSDLLRIYVSDELDQVSRQRFIAQAKLENGLDKPRRRYAFPLPLPLQRLRSAASNHTPAAAGIGVAAAVGIAAAVVLPGIIRDNSNTVRRQPPAYAAPPIPGPDQPGAVDPNPPHATPKPQRTSTSPAAAPSAPADWPVEIAGVSPPVTIPPIKRPGPIPLPSPHRPTHPKVRLRVDLYPLATLTARLHPNLRLRIKLGAEHPMTSPP